MSTTDFTFPASSTSSSVSVFARLVLLPVVHARGVAGRCCVVMLTRFLSFFVVMMVAVLVPAVSALADVGAGPGSGSGAGSTGPAPVIVFSGAAQQPAVITAGQNATVVASVAAPGSLSCEAERTDGTFLTVSGNGTGTGTVSLPVGDITVFCAASANGKSAQAEAGYTVVTAMTAGTPGSVPATPAGAVAGADSNLGAAVGTGNWSGYVEKPSGGQGFTGATGTFTVPAVDQSAPSDATAGLWVGVDGLNQSQLLQAGIMMSPGGPAYAWWVAQNQPATNAGGGVSVGPGEESYSAQAVPITVSTGDQVTVTLSQQQPGVWLIAVTDDTTGQGFTVDAPYDGPGATAEWIMEATGTYSLDGGPATSPLDPPLAPVQWTDAATSGAAPVSGESALLSLQQNGEYLTQATAFTAGAFQISYAPSSSPQLTPVPTAAKAAGEQPSGPTVRPRARVTLLRVCARGRCARVTANRLVRVPALARLVRVTGTGTPGTRFVLTVAGVKHVERVGRAGRFSVLVPYRRGGRRVAVAASAELGAAR